MTDGIKKADRTIAVGVLQIFLGVVLIILFWVIAIISNVWALFISETQAVSIFVPFTGTIIGCFLLWRGFGNYMLASRYRKVSTAIGDDTNIDLSNLENKLNWNRAKLINALNRQISRGYWPDSFLDCSNGVFLKDYNPTLLTANSGDEAVDIMIGTANALTLDMATANRTIDDADLKAQVDKLLDLAKQIYSYVEKNPDKSSLVRKLTNYYLPTTVNLLNDYLDLQKQPVKTENMLDSMEKIKGMMPTIETAFKNHLNDLYEKKSMDVSVEIDVMTKMMDV